MPAQWRLLELFMGSENRKKSELIQVRATPDEKAALRKRADAFSVSVGELCRETIFRTKPSSKTDQQAIAELVATRADLGRLGGLFRGWLGGEAFPIAPMAPDRKPVRELLNEIEVAEKAVLAAVKKLVART